MDKNSFCFLDTIILELLLYVSFLFEFDKLLIFLCDDNILFLNIFSILSIDFDILKNEILFFLCLSLGVFIKFKFDFSSLNVDDGEQLFELLLSLKL